METKHSKGPWRQCEAQPDGIITDDPTGVGCSSPECATSCLEYYGGHLVAESIAPQNRPLISAAPDLFDALQAMLLLKKEGIGLATAKQLGLEDVYRIHGMMAVSEAVSEKARVAIAKATGQEVR